MSERMISPKPIRRALQSLTSRPFDTLAVWLGGYVLAFLIWTLFGQSGKSQANLIAVFGFLPLGLLAVPLLWRASTKPSISQRARQAWQLIALAALLRAVDHGIGLTSEFVRGVPAYGSLTESLHFLSCAALFVGVLRFPHRQTICKGWATFSLDAATVMLGAGMVIWYFFLQPLAAFHHTSTATSLLALAYPVGDLVIIFAITFVLLRHPEPQVQLALNLLAASVLLSAIGNTTYSYAMLQGATASSALGEAIFLVSFFLLAVSGHDHGWSSPPGNEGAKVAEPDQQTVIWLPYSGVILGYGLLLGVTYESWRPDISEPLPILIFGAIGITTLVVVRQLLGVRENARLLAERTARKNEKRFISLVQNSSDIIIITDVQMRLLFLSPSVQRLLGYQHQDLIGANLIELLHPDDATIARAFFAEAAVYPGITPPVEWRIRHRDGNWLHVESVGNNLLSDPSINGIVINARNITERKVLEDQLTHQALHDPLTGLANRALFRDRVEHALVRSRRLRRSVAVMFLDLDNFKTINDSLGHTEGDDLLTTVAERLQNCLRTDDTAARLGGDEFAVLLEESVRIKEAVRVAKRILAAFDKPVWLKGKEAFVSLSIGIAVSASEEESTDNADILLRNADAAMYMAKSRGKGRYEVFEPSMYEAALSRLELEADLRHAVEREELELRYQPIVNFKTGRIVGTEALIRWHHPERGLILPDKFIPLAEETGLISAIGTWVLERACQQCYLWHKMFPQCAPLSMTVNLSGRQLQQAGLADIIAEALRKSGLAPPRLVLEITESVMMQDTEATLGKLRELKALGVRLAMDDFGTGYSSLSYLQRFPIDMLKIDRSFIDVINNGSEESALVQAIITLGQTLRLQIVAEGIEVYEQMEALQGLGCEIGQGYHFARPLTADEIAALLQDPYPAKTLSDYLELPSGIESPTTEIETGIT